MNVHLMFPDGDFDLEQSEPWNGQDLIEDLQLGVLLRAMSVGDEFVHRVCQSAMLSCFQNNADVVGYRQDILKDCLGNASLVKGLYELATSALENRKRSYWGTGVTNYPPSILSGAVETLEIFMGSLAALRTMSDQAKQIHSKGLTTFFERVRTEITEEYLKETTALIQELKPRNGILMGAHLGRGNRGIAYAVLRPRERKGWVQRVFEQKPRVYGFRVDDSSEDAARELGELGNRGLNSIAEIAARAAERLSNFFFSLRTETAFYLGAINLQEQLEKLNEPICFPTLAPMNERKMTCQGLYDASLALGLKQQVVSNDIEADGKSLLVITGANKGGKTTFLRSVGMSQVMMQCGMFVPARTYSANPCRSLFTHFKRKDDANMESGQLEEELSRMSRIADDLHADSMVIFNESFATTNEREGSEIARQIVDALLERRVKVLFVSHLYQFAHDLHHRTTKEMLFLRAPRNADGTRSFKLIEGEPLDTSFGLDLYSKIFGDAASFGLKRD